MLILSYFNKSRTLTSFGRKENSNLSGQFNPVYIVLHKVPEAVVRRRSVKKKDSGAGVFLWVLWNFQEYLFLQNTSGGFFWSGYRNWVLLG